MKLTHSNVTFWKKRNLFGWIDGVELRGPPSPRLKAFCGQLPYLPNSEPKVTLVLSSFHNICAISILLLLKPEI